MRDLNAHKPDHCRLHGRPTCSCYRRRNRRRAIWISARGNISEVPLVLMILFVLVIFPLINLLGLGFAAAASLVIGHQCASQASTQPQFATALSASQQEAVALGQTSFMKFLNFQPVGGYQNSGVDLYVKAEDYHTNAIETYGPNTGVTAPIDVLTYVYEYAARTHFRVSPLIDMSRIPLLSQIPGCGQPVELTFEVCSKAEIPQGVGPGTTTQAATGFGTPPTISDSSFPMVPTSVPGDWNYPNIYQQIAAAGQTVVATEVFVVPANDPNLTMTSINVTANENLWFDFRSDGAWSIGDVASWPLINANGYTSSAMSTSGLTDPNACPAMLVGKLSNTSYFSIGQELTMPSPGTGALGVMMNDGPGAYGYTDDVGQQIVRVVVTVKS